MVRDASPGPAPAAHALASNSRLTRSSWRTWAPPETAQEGPQGGRCLHRAADGASRPAGTQHVGGGDAVATSQRRGHQGQRLVSRIRPTRRISQVNVAIHQFTQSQALGQRHRKEQPSIGHQAVVIKGDLNAVGALRW